MPTPVVYEIAGLSVEIGEGDITQADAAAIVNAANDVLWMGAGVAGAIKRAGGPTVEQEAISRGPIAVGSAIATSAGRLPYENVIHGAVMGQDLRTDAETVARTTRSCLQLARVLRLQSLAFPALGTGVGGLPFDECASAMLGAVREFAQTDRGSLERIVFSLFGPGAVAAFEAEADRMLGLGGE